MNVIIWHNTVERWAMAAGVTVGIFGVLALAKRIIIGRLKRRPESTRFPWEEVAVALARQTKLLSFFYVAVFFGSDFLDIPDKVAHFLDKTALVVFLFQLLVWGTVGITAVVDFYISRAADDGSRATSVRAIGFLVRLAFFVVIILLALDGFGVNITTLVAGLGVGGVAVALAVQSILGDLFASLTIVLDKPFVIGDSIAVDTFSGTIEHVGLKTTRVRSVDGEQVIFPNANLLQSRLRNYKRMQERRQLFTFSIAYGAPVATLEKLPGEVRAIVEAQPRVRFDRAHLRSFGDASLQYEVVYWVLSPDFGVAADTLQRILLALYQGLDDLGVKIAHPTRTLHVVSGVPISSSASSEKL